MRKHNIYFVFFIIYCLSISINFSIISSNYFDLCYEEVYEDEVLVANIYEKKNYNIVKLKTNNYHFFTSVSKDIKLSKLEYIKILFITKNISFFDYLKGFYAKNLYIEKIQKSNIKKEIYENIKTSHKDYKITQLFGALFFAISTDNILRNIFANYSISHLIALSGFHIALISSFIYGILYLPYSYIHQKYFPYRNKKYDLILFTITILFFYLIFTDFVPSLTRAFVMLVIGVIILRSNIKLISFNTLILTILTILVIFPQYIFSIGFWFSIIAVFYIFLYVKYFKNINKYLQILFFNFWIFFVFNPIVHYFFTQTTYEQLLSPFISIFFIVFYPFEIIAHLFGFADILDIYILRFLDYEIFVYDVKTSVWFFVIFIICSLLSINSKKVFYLLNFLTICFNIYLYNPQLI